MLIGPVAPAPEYPFPDHYEISQVMITGKMRSVAIDPKDRPYAQGFSHDVWILSNASQPSQPPAMQWLKLVSYGMKNTVRMRLNSSVAAKATPALRDL